jgi:hypothetical protein
VIDLTAVARKAYFQGIFQDCGQEQCRGLAAIDRAFEASSQQVRQTANMINVDMSENQATEMVNGKADLKWFSDFSALKEPAIDKETAAPV